MFNGRLLSGRLLSKRNAAREQVLHRFQKQVRCVWCHHMSLLREALVTFSFLLLLIVIVAAVLEQTTIAPPAHGHSFRLHGRAST